MINLGASSGLWRLKSVSSGVVQGLFALPNLYGRCSHGRQYETPRFDKSSLSSPVDRNSATGEEFLALENTGYLRAPYIINLHPEPLPHLLC